MIVCHCQYFVCRGNKSDLDNLRLDWSRVGEGGSQSNFLSRIDSKMANPKNDLNFSVLMN